MSGNSSVHPARSLAAGFIFVSVLGTLSHFFYDWSGENVIVSLFCPVSESVWEHMKLLFFPALLWTAFLPGRRADGRPCLRTSLIIGCLAGTLSIPVLFYTYSGILGYTVTWIDIFLFYAAVFLTFCFAGVHKNTDRICQAKYPALLLSAVLSVLFFLFTFFPPSIGLFDVP